MRLLLFSSHFQVRVSQWSEKKEAEIRRDESWVAPRLQCCTPPWTCKNLTESKNIGTTQIVREIQNPGSNILCTRFHMKYHQEAARTLQNRQSSGDRSMSTQNSGLVGVRYWGWNLLVQAWTRLNTISWRTVFVYNIMIDAVSQVPTLATKSVTPIRSYTSLSLRWHILII